MTSPPNPPQTPAPTPQLSGNARLGARAMLAARRSARFAKLWGGSFGLLTLLALLVPVLSRDPETASRAANGLLAADTLRSAQRLREALAAEESADSVLAVALEIRVATAVPVPATRLPAVSPATVELVARIERARRERSTAAMVAVTEHPAVSAGPRMRALADSLRAYDARTRTDAAIGPAQRAAIQERIARTSNTILAIAQNRRTELEAAGVVAVPAAPASLRSAVVAQRVVPSARVSDTAALRAVLVSAREAVVAVRRTRDSLTAAARTLDVADTSRERGLSLAAASPAIAMATLLVVGLLLRFATALSREMNAPTLADATEAERYARAPVLTTVREAMLEGPARFHPSGIDPFRILYLGLTATGTRVRTAIVTGADPVIAAATGARLAIAAAADHRQTLIVDLDAVNIPLSRTFRERAEPGTNDALAHAFTWREVARPVGSSDGLPITLLPAGTERQDLSSGAEQRELMEQFMRLRASYELTIVVAPPDRIALAATLVEAGPVILTAVAGETLLADLEREVAAIRSSSHRIQGVVLWDAPRPELPSRAELAAMLSKRKGRTPGGSFEAVQRAISPNRSDIKKT